MIPTLFNSGLLGSTSGGGAVGGWVELGRTTLGSAGDTITVSSLADKRYYMILESRLTASTANNDYLRMGNSTIDTGSNYSYRYSQNGAADGTATSNNIIAHGFFASTTPKFMVNYLANLSGNEKLLLAHAIDQNTAGASNSPFRNETTGKWVNTSNPFDIWQTRSDNGVKTYASGSEVVVLGWDPDDTHTNNFWEELASVDLSGGAADQISSGTITAKKYLWVQGYFEDSGGAINQEITFNNDTSNNYAVRHNVDGGTDTTSTSRANGYIGVGGITSPNFLNFFIINNASNEKLVIGQDVTQNTAGATTAPRRAEGVFKWDNTSNQITEIDFDNSAAGSYGTKTTIKVWGAD